MDTIRKALAVMVKDLKVLSSDRGFLISMVIFPLIVAFINGAANPAGQGINIPVIVVNQDTGTYGATISQILKEINELELSESNSPDEADEKVGNGEFIAAILIPADLSQRVDDYLPAEITIILDPAQVEYGQILTTVMEEVAGALAIQGEIHYGVRIALADIGINEGADPALWRAAQAQVEGVLFTQLQRMQTDAPIQIISESLQGEHIFKWDKPFDLMLPGLAVMFAFFIMPALASELLKEKEAGSLRRLVAAPLPRAALIGGKVLAYLLVVVVQMALLFGVGAIFMGMGLGQSLLGLFLVIVALGLAATTLGMLIAAIARSVEQAATIGLLLIFVLGFLSGSFSPAAAPYRGEGFVAILSRYIPQSQATIAFHSLLLQNGGVLDVLPQVGYLFGLSLLLFGFTLWRFKFE